MGLKQEVDFLVQTPTIVDGSVTANWNSGVATSGLAGADLFSIGRAGQWYLLNQGCVLVAGFNVAATITIREYGWVMGAERLLYTDTYTFADDIVFFSIWLDMEMYGIYRVEIHSDQATDDGLTVPYEYRIKDWV